MASAAGWLPYGLFCFWYPGYLDGAAGVVGATTTGRIELRAMYGGLQAAVGCLTLMGALRPAARQSALTAVTFLCGGLFLSRLTGTLLEGELSSYTAGALVFESLSALIALYFWKRE